MKNATEALKLERISDEEFKDYSSTFVTSFDADNGTLSRIQWIGMEFLIQSMWKIGAPRPCWIVVVPPNFVGGDRLISQPFHDSEFGLVLELIGHFCTADFAKSYGDNRLDSQLAKNHPGWQKVRNWSR